MTPTPTETEYCWRVVGADPEAILDRIAGTPSLAGLAVRSAGTVDIEDAVFDRADGALAAAKLTLRLRIKDAGTPLVTIKGPTQRTDDGATRRPELEEPFSKDSLARALQFLADLGGPAPPAAETLGSLPDSAVEALEQLGFAPVHRRRNRRRLAYLLAAEGHELVELALDAVTYRAGGRDVLHHEVEAELVAGAEDEVAGAVEALRRVGGDELVPWPHSKTQIGKAIDRAAARGDLGAWLADSGQLTEAAYRAIDVELQS